MTRSAWILVLILAAAVGVAGVALVRLEGDAPRVAGPGEVVLGTPARTVELELSDRGSGLREVRVTLEHAQGQALLLERHFVGSLLAGRGPGSEHVEVLLDAGALGVPEGAAFLVVDARDWSWRGLLSGNATALRIPVAVDLQPPRVSVLSGLTYVRRGGAALVVYRASEVPARDGVEVGERFYPGQARPQACPDAAGDERCRVALFALAVDAPEDPAIQVMAEDAAGNQARVRFRARVQPREIPHVPIRLSREFLEDKIGELAQEWNVEGADLVAKFQTINRERRAQDEERIQQLVGEARPERLWQGAFHQLPNSQVTSLFAERRRYLYEGKEVSEATHYGYDLASYAGAAVTASNTGRVLYAGPLGIYGETVLLDHGMGLVSLYGHLSAIDVAEGAVVERDAVLGRTGATGLAGGDHLHFAILLHGTYVDPREWWDPRWVRDHVSARLDAP